MGAELLARYGGHLFRDHRGGRSRRTRFFLGAMAERTRRKSFCLRDTIQCLFLFRLGLIFVVSNFFTSIAPGQALFTGIVPAQ